MCLALFSIAAADGVARPELIVVGLLGQQPSTREYNVIIIN